MQHLKRCPNGHFYDPVNHASCPHCEDVQEVFDVPDAEPVSVREPDAIEAPLTAYRTPAPFGSDDERTVGVTPQKLGVDPVVGWLVCVVGVNRGRDWRLHGEHNYIGRGENMDVRVTGDNAISRENHACLSYDARNGVYTLIPGISRNIVYVNDEEIAAPTRLKERDRIEIGKSIFVFVPLCAGGFNWQGSEGG